MAVPDVRGRALAWLRTARGAAVEEAAFLSFADDPGVSHEALVTWSSLGVDRACAILTPDDDDHHVELMAGTNAGPLWIGVCDSVGVSDVVLDGSFCRFRSRPSGDQLSCLLDEE